MNHRPKCPVCDAECWLTIGQRTYRLADLPSLSDYCARRYRVLFEVWFPGETEIRFEWKLCGRCGFVLYTPRPTDEDLDRKYRLLTALGKDQDAHEADSPIETARARELFRHATRVRGRSNGVTVLDFGGGDGRLMRPFVRAGWQCNVVDYCRQVVPGVKRLCSTLDELPADLKFDLIVCSHVLEHVADPVDTLARLRTILDEKGTLYVEVPMEIWRRPPIHEEPVTHVNFFTLDSLRFALQRAGVRGLCRLGTHLYYGNRRPRVLRAWVRRDRHASPPRPHSRAAANTQRLLRPGLCMRLRFAALEPGSAAKTILRRALGR